MAGIRTLLAAVFFAVLAYPAAASCGKADARAPCRIPEGEYRIVLPDRDPPYPTVLYLYGSLGNSGRLVNARFFVESFTRRGYALIIPIALNLRYRSGPGSGWFLRNSKARKDRDDIAFVRAVLEDARIHHGIDRNRVLIAGMSNGGFLAWEIACHAPDTAAAYAPVAAGYLGDMPRKCVKPVRLLHTHGRKDKVVTLDESGDRISGGARIMALDDSLDALAHSNRCVKPGEARKVLDYTRTRWEGCPSGASLELLLHEGGHTIPRSWFGYVLDWFEGPGEVSPALGGGTAMFRKNDEDSGRFRDSTRPDGRFRGARRSGGRFKKAAE